MSVNNLMEISFNIAYLAIIYVIVVVMAVKYKKGLAGNKKVSSLFIFACILLAVGDTGHVGFRVIAYLNGGLEANSMLIGAGNLATALTVTIFYMLMFELLRVYTDKNRSPVYWLIIFLGLARIIFMLFPGNNWSGETPLTYSYIRNAILTLMGIITAVLYLREGIAKKDGTLKLFAAFIFISYGFYLPVILFVHLVPMIGMLMIPKTCAYIAVAIVGCKRLFKKN